MTPRDQHLFSPGPKRILSLDGGGIRGIVSLAFLERLEALLRARTGDPALCLADYFDLIGGTSTGAIIAAGLALGHPVAHLVEVYLTLAREGFQRRWWLGGTLVPKFRAAALEAAIRAHVGDETLGSDKLRTGLAIVAKRLDTGSVWVFHNNPRGPFFASTDGSGTAVPNRDLPLGNLIRASTAAPSYFEPELIEVAPGVTGAFIDGGLSPHLNPALQMLMLATLEGYGFRWPMGVERLLLVSVGTGGGGPFAEARAIARLPAAWLAVSALRSMMSDSNWLTQTLLQWLGQSPTLWPIDAEIGALAGDCLGPQKLLHYLRYDAILEADWLKAEVGMDVAEDELSALQAMDRPALAPRLLEIGRRVAAARLHLEHFPAVFDRVKAGVEAGVA